MKKKPARKAREWWVHEDGTYGEEIYACDTPRDQQCGCCVQSERFLVREVLPRKKGKT